MRTAVFRTLSAVLGVALGAVGLLMLVQRGLEQASYLLAGIALVGMGVFFLNFAITGKRTLLAHRFTKKDG